MNLTDYNGDLKIEPYHKAKYFNIHEVQGNFKTETLNLVLLDRKNIIIGYINFYTKWNKYVFTCVDGVIFDSDCLYELDNFMRTKL